MTSVEQASAATRSSDDFSYHNVHSIDPIMSDDVRVVLETTFFVALCGPISFLGSVVNVINIIIFFKQGFGDSVNISLCALAVSDMGSLLPMVWVAICSNPLFQYSDISFDSVDIYYLTGGLLHSCFSRITGLITAFITFERCVCIALPLKVKNIITSTRTLIAMIAIFLIIFATVAPLYSSVYFAPIFHAKRNKSLIGTIYTNTTVTFKNAAFYFYVSVQLTSFISVIICTAILVQKLLAKSLWRQKASSMSDDSLSIRDKIVMKMVTSISVIFIICYIPSVVNLMLVVHLSPDYTATGRYANPYIASWAIINTIEVINSSVTIFVYYMMSSKFRNTFHEFFHASRNCSVNTKISIRKKPIFSDNTL